MAYLNHLLTFIESNPALAIGFNLILLVVSGIFAHLLCKFLLIKVLLCSAVYAQYAGIAGNGD